ncbi:MAG: class I SAM-dependent methyltransferase [Chitinophagaceae bacterium]
MKDIYNDGTYLKNNPTWDAEDALLKAEKILELLEKIPISFKTICEVGCGSAEILYQLSKKLRGNVAFFGFDVSKNAITIAKKKETAKIKIEQKDIASSPDENYFFDVILVIDVIEHVDNYFKFLDGIINKSKYTIFHIPLDMCVWSLFREKMLLESKERVGHIHNFTEDFIKSILIDHGFKILQQIYTAPTFQVKSLKQTFINNIRKFLFRINKKFCSKTLGGYSILLLTENVNNKL